MIRSTTLWQRALLGWLAVWLVATGSAGAQAQALVRELLNSERIEQAFGSYGITVLRNENNIRVSKLYSVHEGVEVCRTFAVVVYPANVAGALTEAHELIASGQSIGATFASRGWTVIKTHKYFGTLASTPGLRALMGQRSATDLAVHVYVLSVAKEGEEYEYVTIAEVHHPAYLQVEDLYEIYDSGMDLTIRRDAGTQKILDLVAAQMP